MSEEFTAAMRPMLTPFHLRRATGSGRSKFPAHVLLFIIPALMLASCGGQSDRFRLEGRFKNMNQAEFYIYDAEDGQKDTIHVRDGRFEYQRVMTDTTLLLLMFPNYSEMPLFAAPGTSLSMKGDASHLRETEIKGEEVNEEMTAFRMDINELTPPQQRQRAQDYVGSHPQSAIATFLVERFFLQGEEPDYQLAYRLMADIVAKQPGNGRARRLMSQLEKLKNTAGKGRLPRFSVRDTNNKLVDNSALQADYNVIYVWASWNFDTQNTLRLLNRKQKESKGRLSVVTICLDPSKDEGRATLERDTITWPNICDGQMWQSPVLAQLGFATMGANVLTDRQGNILARNLTSSQLREKITALLK